MATIKGNGIDFNGKSPMEYNEDEILELIWTAREEGKESLDEIPQLRHGKEVKHLLKNMAKKGLIALKDNRVYFQSMGEKEAAEIIRRHRLAETLLSIVFELEESQVEHTACKFEHILSTKVTESVCTFLGHPRYCPHGKSIPPAECCNKYRVDVKPLVTRLCDFELGNEGRVVFISPKHRHRLTQLSSLGLIPGSVVRLLQRQPSYVISIGQTDIAVDKDIAKDIYVKKV
jgi:DtxR family Mn-dependent transcriptional regulator